MRAFLLLSVIACAAAFSSPKHAEAHLVHVAETIYGMDCAPCAHGVERRLSRMDGVTEVTLSLNEGSAVVRLAEGNTVTLRDIRKAVRQSGFSAEGGTVSVRGSATRADGTLELRTPAGEVFAVRGDPGERVRGTALEVTGRVAKDPDGQGRWVLQADRVSPLPN